MRIQLILNGSRERYAGGADQGRLKVWSTYCSPGTQIDLGYLPGERETQGLSRNYAFGQGEAVRNHALLYPDACVAAAENGYDAVIMHCCSDPGLYESRRRASIPVIGPGEATLRAGVIVGRSIGMTVPTDAAVAHHRQQVRDVGVAEHVVGLEPINQPIDNYAGQDAAAMTDALVAAAQRLLDRGADVICPSGLAFIPVRVSAREVSNRLGVPVLDPAYIAVRTAEMLVTASRSDRTAPPQVSIDDGG
jgi:Asp/Glu/hydantoin racemase